jgi:acyl-coenzyme A synthetase/AMP-(fatty) acid ligase/acyl carrier protein
MVNHLFAKIEDLQLESRDRIAQTASQYFDISVWQMLAALVVGGSVCIFGDEEVRDAAQLPLGIERRSVTIVETVPSLLRAIVEELASVGMSRAGLSSVLWMIVTGETLAPELCRQWLSLYPHIPLLNAYGPTECSDDVTHQPISEPPRADATAMPIGRALQNMRLYVLDRRFEPVPLGVLGEICVAGVGVGRGYLNEVGRTADVFVPDPFGAAGGERLYRTGDVGRFLPDGAIEFVGRLDHQVKVRGFRIELGEIEATLSEHSGVRGCAVLVRGESQEEQRIVAYVVAAGDDAPTVEELRGFLQKRLPAYMLPSVFVMLKTLPLTPNGKVDLKALPAPDASSFECSNGYVAPRNSTEERLAAIWVELLGVERVGINDNFFESGGHSLLATRVTSRVRAAFEIELPLRTFFESPTVKGLAAWVDERLAAQSPRAVVAPRIQARPRGQKNLEGLLSKINQLSRTEVERLLAEKRTPNEEMANG